MVCRLRCCCLGALVVLITLGGPACRCDDASAPASPAIPTSPSTPAAAVPAAAPPGPDCTTATQAELLLQPPTLLVERLRAYGTAAGWPEIAPSLEQIQAVLLGLRVSSSTEQPPDPSRPLRLVIRRATGRSWQYNLLRDPVAPVVAATAPLLRATVCRGELPRHLEGELGQRLDRSLRQLVTHGVPAGSAKELGAAARQVLGLLGELGPLPFVVDVAAPGDVARVELALRPIPPAAPLRDLVRAVIEELFSFSPKRRVEARIQVREVLDELDGRGTVEVRWAAGRALPQARVWLGVRRPERARAALDRLLANFDRTPLVAALRQRGLELVLAPRTGTVAGHLFLGPPGGETAPVPPPPARTTDTVLLRAEPVGGEFRLRLTVPAAALQGLVAQARLRHPGARPRR